MKWIQTRETPQAAFPFRLARAGWVLLLLLAAPSLSASGYETWDSYLDVESNVYFWLRSSHGEHIGDEPGYMATGGTGFAHDWHGASMVVGQLMLTEHGRTGTNIGLVRRMYLFEDSVVGGGIWYDGYNSKRGNWYNQISGSFEWFRDDPWTFRANGFFPLGQREHRIRSVDEFGGGPGIGEVEFRGNFLVTGEDILRRSLDEVAMTGADVELARTIGNWASEAYGAYYHLQGGGHRIDGARVGARGYLTPRLAANLTLSYDRLFGANFFGGFTWFFGGTGGNAPKRLYDKLTIPVQRREQIVLTDRWTEELIPNVAVLTDQEVPITVAHIRQGAPGENAGTFEDPYNLGTLPATQGTNIVYVHANGTYTNGYTLAPNQRFLGEGDGNLHLVMTDQLGWTELPAGSGGTNRPTIRGMLITTAGGEISNFNLEPASVGVRVSGVSNPANINRTSITGGVNGVEILGGTGTIHLTDVAITDPSNFGLAINGGSTDVHFGSLEIDPTEGLHGPSRISQTTPGTAVFIGGGHTGTFTQTAGSTIESSGGIGLRFDNADGDYDFAGPVTLAGTAAGIGIFNGSSGNFTFANTEIIGPTGIALDIRNSSANVDYLGGSIVQTNTSAAVSIVNHAAGTINVDVGIVANAGQGLQFHNADGTYNFTGPITLTSGNAGINIANNSAGTFRFDSADINSATGVALQVQNSSANVDYLSGSILSTSADPAVAISGGSGNLNIGASITNTAGRSVTVQGRTGGAVNLSGNITDTGTGISVVNNIGGSTTFSGDSKALNTGANTAVTLSTNTGHTINFTGGGLNINTSGDVTAFGAVAGGTLNVTGPDNHINTADQGGTGTALFVSNVAIGADNLVFQSISVDGAVNGIVLNNTGTAGGLKVTGDGTGTPNDSGGTLLNTSAHAVSLTNTTHVELNQMRIDGAGGHGIFASHVGGSGTMNLTIEDNTIANTASEAIGFNSSGANQPRSNLRIANNRLIGATGMLFETAGTAEACLDIVGNDNGAGGSPGTLTFDIGGTSKQTITQASIAALEADNHGATVVELSGTLEFNGDCNIP